METMHCVFLVGLPHMTLFHDISTASLIVPGWEIYTSPSMANERARHTTYVIELRQGGGFLASMKMRSRFSILLHAA